MVVDGFDKESLRMLSGLSEIILNFQAEIVKIVAQENKMYPMGKYCFEIKRHNCSYAETTRMFTINLLFICAILQVHSITY